MASERDEAKSEIVRRDDSDAELETTLRSASHYQLEITKEKNRHEEAKRDKDLGFFGRVLGGEKTAPSVIAMFVVFIGFAVAIGSLVAAGYQPDSSEFWSKQAERGLGVASAALAYIFGKGST